MGEYITIWDDMCLHLVPDSWVEYTDIRVKAREHIEELKEHYDVGDSDDNELFIAAWRAALEQSSKNISAREALKGARKM